MSLLGWDTPISSFGTRLHPMTNTSIFGDHVVFGQFDLLALHTNVASLCMLYCIYYGECSEKLFNFVPAVDFRHRSVGRKYHRHNFDSINNFLLLIVLNVKYDRAVAVIAGGEATHVQRSAILSTNVFVEYL
ncbi:hypothetical protein EVAR_27902_1 [Eumeta japonica]|uniref:Uncharacterized protein n=1 Tax=Eumeta variegata TaxID=151549 RepID=A0A4C1UVM8_EUMVA|nr:hypothetical protein EVAR_27902_1 [Eumeta japonica]